MPLSVERFNWGHSLVTNKLPKPAGLGIYVDIPEASKQLDISKFGLFDSCSPDFNTYYPDVTAEDLKPKDEEFVYPVFRALSAIIINKYGPIDFGKNNVLKKSLALLVGQAMLTNHDQLVGAEVGVVIESAWEKEKKYDTYTIPAGINIKMKLDGKSNPKLVRSVMMDPPSVHSISVTVAFKWDQSHPDMGVDEFYNKLGTFDADGNMIKRVVTEIVRYDEVSFVTHGADPFAQKIVDGTIVNPEYAKKVYQFSAENKERITHSIDWKNFDFSQSSLSADGTIPAESLITNNNQNQKNMKPELLAFLIAQFGLAAGSTEEQVIAKLNSDLPTIIAGNSGSVTLKTELDGLKLKYPEGSVILSAEDKTKLAKYDEMDGYMVKVMKATQAETLRLYHLSVGGADKGDAAITTMISAASFDTLTALAKQYSALAEKSFTAECLDCHSHNIKRSSSINPDSGVAGEKNPDEEEKSDKSIAEISNTLFEKALGGSKAGMIHGTKK